MSNQALTHPLLFVSIGALADASLLAQWETHLLPLQQAGLLTFWSGRHINAGVSRSDQFTDHLERADCVILLISANFFSDTECLMWMKYVLLHQQESSIKIIPLLLRPVAWQESELALFPCLPVNKTPLTQWPDLDEAFLSCIQELRLLLRLPGRQISMQQKRQFEEKHSFTLFSLRFLGSAKYWRMYLVKLFFFMLPSLILLVLGINKLMYMIPALAGLYSFSIGTPLIGCIFIIVNVVVVAFALYLFPKTPLSISTTHFTFLYLLWKIAMFIFITSFLVSTCLLTIAFLRPSWCFPSFCQSLAITNNPDTVSDQNLKVSLIAIHHTAFVIPGTPAQWSENALPEEDDANLPGQPGMYQIILGVTNLQTSSFDLFIEKVSLIVDKVNPVPYPLNIWNAGPAVNYTTNPYIAIYNGEKAKTPFAANYEAVPYAHVHLTANESDELSIQVSSRVTAAIQFQLQIIYGFAPELQPNPPLLLPHKFAIVFSDAKNWHSYQLQNGSFVPDQP